MKSGLALQLALGDNFRVRRLRFIFTTHLPPQLHVRVVLGWQYAVLAKCVYGVKDAICALLRGVMDSLGSRGVARTDRTLIIAERTNDDRPGVLIIVPALANGQALYTI